MATKVQVKVKPEQRGDTKFLKTVISEKLNLQSEEVHNYRVIRENIDARKRQVLYVLTVVVNEKEKPATPSFHFQKVHNANPIFIVGAGPAGLFAALKALEKGRKPIVLERGKNVKNRRRDLAQLTKKHEVNPHSNYCFGEGGAGTYSDGKLYTRSKKRGNQLEILEKLVFFGAHEDILVKAHPHIGTNKLPQIITKIRETIIDQGGEIRFGAHVSDLSIHDNKLTGVTWQNLTSENVNHEPTDQLVIATGHSARDIFLLLHQKNVELEFKPFALGVRVEHPQALINSMQYHCSVDELTETMKFLPPASYSWVQQVKGKGVYSFCMCPGGIIAPCATQQEEVVTNGWSPSKRNNPWANSGIVTEVDWGAIPKFHHHGPLAGMYFQADVEKKMWVAGGKTQQAPAQRLIDFIEGKNSKTLPSCSYLPGITSAPIHQLLPNFVTVRLQKAFQQIGKKMKGYLTNEAVVVAIESRTSSPVRIPRNRETYEHISVKGLYPVGEGAGYAGGIVSAAMDGSNAMEKLVLRKA